MTLRFVAAGFRHIGPPFCGTDRFGYSGEAFFDGIAKWRGEKRHALQGWIRGWRCIT